MAAASKLALFACGIFFLTGLLTGVWKYLATSRSAQSEAPRYVSIAHRSSLLYSFAVLVLIEFVKFSPYSETINLIAVAVPVLFFAVAITTYIVHGATRDTENQFQKPYRLGKLSLSPLVFHAMTWLLILGEVGGFLVLFVGFLQALVAGA